MRGRERDGADRDRAVAPAIGYVLALAVTTVLVAMIVTAGGTVVDDQRDRGARSQLNVIGEQVAGDLASADRLVQVADSPDPTVEIERRFPNQIVGSAYRIELNSGSPPTLELSTTDPDVTVTIELVLDTDVDDSSSEGGTVRVTFDDSSDALEVGDG